jgi:phosphohistidine phosphatase
MRRLMLLRHAKALRAEGLADFQRPLKPAGRDQARLIGEFMAERGFVPSLAVASAAVRARETFDLVDIFLHPPPERIEEPLIYEATTAGLFEIVRRLPDRHASVLLVGHNPSFEELANELIAGGEEAAVSRFGRSMPTSALAVIDFTVERWSKITRNSGRLAYFATPDLVEAKK